jgi:homoaconitase/3-isopropylmalate dehydratase large subunit
MDVKNLTWEQIKELAEMAIENGSNFSIVGTDSGMSIYITKAKSSSDKITVSEPWKAEPPYVTWCNNDTNMTHTAHKSGEPIHPQQQID